MKSKLNIIALIFASVFIITGIVRFDNLETIDIVFHVCAIIGLTLMGIAPLFNKKK